MHDTIQFTRATRAHIAGFLELQAENLLANLSESEQANGFVTTPFTTEQLEQLIDEEDLFVALDGELVMAYIVCASWAYLNQYPIFTYMVSLFPDITWDNHHITTDNSYQYGPVCIAKAYRGQGIFTEFFHFCRKAMAEKYPYSLTFVNSRNIRSREAHKRKLGLDHIQDFQFNEQTYHMLGFVTE